MRVEPLVGHRDPDAWMILAIVDRDDRLPDAAVRIEVYGRRGAAGEVPEVLRIDGVGGKAGRRLPREQVAGVERCRDQVRATQVEESGEVAGQRELGCPGVVREHGLRRVRAGRVEQVAGADGDAGQPAGAEGVEVEESSVDGARRRGRLDGIHHHDRHVDVQGRISSS